MKRWHEKNERERERGMELRERERGGQRTEDPTPLSCACAAVLHCWQAQALLEASRKEQRATLGRVGRRGSYPLLLAAKEEEDPLTAWRRTRRYRWR